MKKTTNEPMAHSKDFWTRCFGIWGNAIAAQFAVYFAIACVVGILMLLGKFF